MIKKILKKIIKLVFILIIGYLIFFQIQKYFINKSSNLKETNIQDNYTMKYPYKDYVTEAKESYPFYFNFVIKMMLSYQEIENSENNLDLIKIIANNLLQNNMNYSKKIMNMQYNEKKLVSLTKDDTEENIFNILGYNEFGSPVKGNLALYQGEENMQLIIPLTEDDKINKNLVTLLIDDSNSELLTYLIIKETQKINKTDLDPNEASKKFFDGNIEKLAGDISYHAVVLYLMDQYDEEYNEIVYSKVKTINITQDDFENKFINRIY